MASETEQSKKGLEILDKCYSSAINGLPISQTATELANEYLSKNNYDSQKAAKNMIEEQTAKCNDITGVPIGRLYIQIRMIAAIAVMGGYDLNDNYVKTLVYTTLVNMPLTDIVKESELKVKNKITKNTIRKIPEEKLIKINQEIGQMLLTKANSVGMIDINKSGLNPCVGLIYIDRDSIYIQMAAERAVKLFLN